MTNSNENWLAAYLYYAELWEDLLRKALKPFVEKSFTEKLAGQFFFIRYWELGPHIRLRFKGDANILIDKLKPELNNFFNAYFKQNPSKRQEPEWIKELGEEDRWFPNNSIQYIKYEPEIERYGGPRGMLISEKQFEASSRAVLEIIEQSEEWDYDRALGAAIQLHLGFAFALGMDKIETLKFYSIIFESWFSHAYGFEENISKENLSKRQKITLKAFDVQFSKVETTLVPYCQNLWEALEYGVEFEQDWLNRWLFDMKTIGDELDELQKKQQLIFPGWIRIKQDLKVAEERQKLWQIFASYVHMTNNRLGILNHDEAYLGYLIKRSIENL